MSEEKTTNQAETAATSEPKPYVMRFHTDDKVSALTLETAATAANLVLKDPEAVKTEKEGGDMLIVTCKGDKDMKIASTFASAYATLTGKEYEAAVGEMLAAHYFASKKKSKKTNETQMSNYEEYLHGISAEPKKANTNKNSVHPNLMPDGFFGASPLFEPSDKGGYTEEQQRVINSSLTSKLSEASSGTVNIDNEQQRTPTENGYSR